VTPTSGANVTLSIYSLSNIRCPSTAQFDLMINVSEEPAQNVQLYVNMKAGGSS
jgi:hypothetical protein